MSGCNGKCKCKYNITELVKDSILCYPGMETYWPQYQTESILDVRSIKAKCELCFSQDRDVIAFVYNGDYYATPYTQKALCCLSREGFHERSFLVAFSSSEYPIKEKDRWEELKKNAYKR